MLHPNNNPRFGRGLLLAAVVAAASSFALPAFAGGCPADLKKTDAREPVDFKPVGVADTVIASIDVSKAPFNIDGRNFRMRKLTVEPPTVQPLSTSPKVRSSNTRRTALGRSCTRPVTSSPRHLRFRIGGRISATRPPCCFPPICCTIRVTTICEGVFPDAPTPGHDAPTVSSPVGA
jgi:hypothetical protein